MKRFLTKNIFWGVVVWLVLTSVGILILTPKVLAQNSDLVYGGSDVPVILPRSNWDNTSALNALMTWVPQQDNSVDGLPSDWQPVERIIVHDTGCDVKNPTCNSNIDPVATIQAIYRYHAVTRGWGDIGYNYIIDQQGRIYEGRYGGNGSRGAHLYVDRTRDNFNFGTIGITILGNYGATPPPQAALDSLTRLAAWLSAANGLEPLAQKSSYIWQTDTKSFSTFFSGPVIAGHKDVEPGNPDPGKVDCAKLRQDATVLAAKFKNYIYQVGGFNKIYELRNGTRRVFANLADFTAQGINYSNVVNISQSQLDIFSETRFFKYPDGSFLQINGAPSVYLIESGQKRKLELTAKQFTALDFDFNKVKKTTADELASYPDGLVIKYGPEKALLSDGSRVFYIQGGRKHWVTSRELFAALGFKWPKVKVAAADLATYLEGNIMTYPSGVLFRAQDQPAVYLISGKEKRQFVSAQSFVKLGYKWDKILVSDSFEIALYPAGDIVPYKDGTLIKTQDLPTVFLIEGGKARPFLSQEIFDNLKYKAAEILTVSFDEMVYYPPGTPVAYKDGMLVRPSDRNNVYLISGGQAQVVDAAAFKKKKYRWADVYAILPDDFGILYEGKSTISSNLSSGFLSTITPIPVPTPAPLLSSTPSLTPSPVTAASDATSAGTGVSMSGNVGSGTSARDLSQGSENATSAGTGVSMSGNVGSGTAEPRIRVAIFEVVSSIIILTADSAYDVLGKNGEIIASKNANENYAYTIAAPADAFVKIVPRSVDGIVEIVSYEDRPAWKPSLNYNQFRGAVEIVYSVKSGKVWAVNELNLEDYLKGIGEINQNDLAGHQKTMIVAARTYAYYYILKGGKRGEDEVYILNNTSSDQLYKGYSREAVAPAIAEAVNTTRGEMVIYNGQPIITAYSSGAPELLAGGTKSGCAVWGQHFCETGFAYLSGGVKDPAGAPYTQSICGGGNHCVGLSAAGSRAFAQSGAKNYREVLEYYYKGTEMKRVY